MVALILQLVINLKVAKVFKKVVLGNMDYTSGDDTPIQLIRYEIHARTK